VADTRVRIDRLVVRVRGVPESSARGMVRALGTSVLRHLGTAVTQAPPPAPLTRVDRVDAGTIRFANQEHAAKAIATAVIARLSADGD